MMKNIDKKSEAPSLNDEKLNQVSGGSNTPDPSSGPIEPPVINITSAAENKRTSR